MATDNIALVKRLVDEVWNKGYMNVADQLSSRDVKFYDPISKELSSLDAFKKHVQALRAAFPDMHVTIDDVAMSGDKVYSRWTGTGTNEGSFLGAGPTNKACVVRGISTHRIQNGKIVETWESYDVLGLLQQLGLAPPIEKLPQVAAAMASMH